jgi:hypothetical protein
MTSAFPQHIHELHELMQESREQAGEALYSEDTDRNQDSTPVSWTNGVGWADFTKNL